MTVVDGDDDDDDDDEVDVVVVVGNASRGVPDSRGGCRLTGVRGKWSSYRLGKFFAHKQSSKWPAANETWTC